MPLQNRMQPNGEIIAHSSRGLLMGNRGGRIHESHSRVLHPTKRWATKQWITCVLEFKNRQRELMAPNRYTELFFMDEVTALAAGHRPCFECRRKSAVSYAEALQRETNLDKRPSASEIDKLLHEQRLSQRKKQTHEVNWNDLPDGAMVEIDGNWIAKNSNRALLWTFEGYEIAGANFTKELKTPVDCLTPPANLAVLKNGYQPLWHTSANLV